VFHAGFNGSSPANIRPYDYCQPFTRDNIFAVQADQKPDSSQWGVQHAGLDYMLLFNLYKMAQLQIWHHDYSPTDDMVKSCPCSVYPSLTYTSQVRSISET